MFRKIVVAFFVFTVIGSTAFAERKAREKKEPEPQAAPHVQVKYDEAQKFILNNGMTVILQRMPTVKAVAMQTWIKSGTINEKEYLGTGISHFVEHMIFKGTKKRKEGDFAREIKNAGGDLNGYTTNDRIVYLLTVGSNFFDTGLDALADVVMNSTFDSTDFEKEKEVVLKEINMNEDSPERKIDRIFWEEIYKEHPYRYPVIGYREYFKNLTRDDLYNYYKRTHIPNNMIFVAVGDFDVNEAIGKIKNAFSEFKPQLLAPSLIEPEPKQIIERNVIKEWDVKVTRMSMGFRTVDFYDNDMYPLDVLAIILGDGEASVLSKKLKDELALVYNVHAFSYTPQYPGIFGVSVQLDDKNTARVQEEIWKVIDGVKKGKISDEEINMAKQKVASGHIFSRQTIEGVAGQLASDEMLTSDLNFDEIYVQRIKEVKKNDLARVASKYFERLNLTVAVLRPVQPKEEQGKKEAVSAEVPSVKKFTLSNKAALLIKEDRRLPIVSIRMSFLGGIRYENENNNGITNFMKELFLKGTKKNKGEEIVKKIESRGGKIDVFSGRNSFGITVDVLKENLNEALVILNEIVTSAEFSEEQIKKVRERILADIDKEEDEIFPVASNLFMSTLFERHPYRLRKFGTKKSIEGITRIDIVKYYSDFCRPNNMVLSIYGDINTEKTSKDVEKIFSGFKAKDMPYILVPEELKQLNSRTAKENKEKAQTVIIIGYLAPNIKSLDYYPIEVLNSVLNGLGSRMFEELRGQKSLAYYVGGYYVPGLETGAYLFYIGTVKEKKDEAVNGMLEQIKKLREEDITPEELKMAKRNLIGEKALSLQTIGSQAYSASLNELYGLGFDWDDKYNEEINKVTAENIKSVAQRYFDLNAYTIAIVEPEEKK